MESKDQLKLTAGQTSEDKCSETMSAEDEEEQIKTLLEEIKQNQIILEQHDLLLSAVKVAQSNPALDESVRDTVNRVLVHDAFLESGLPESFFSTPTIEKNAAAKLSYAESIPLTTIVEKELENKCKEIIAKGEGVKVAAISNVNSLEHNVKIKLYLECAAELRRAKELMCEEQEIFSNLVDLRKNLLDDLQNSVHHSTAEYQLLALKAKVERLSLQQSMLTEDQDMPAALRKLAAFWEREREKSEAAVRKAEQDRETYMRLEKDNHYKVLLKEYLDVVKQTRNVQNALGMF